MSRFIVTSGSDFRPFSYDELIKPVKDSAEAHAAAADAYDQLSMETAALGNYISSEKGSGDVRARAMYDNYMQKLQNFQNNLWENGVTAGTRRDMTVARFAYAQDITRLQKAIQDRQTRSQEYWTAKHNHPDLIMGADPGLGGLDNYLDNDQYGKNWYAYSGDSFVNEVGMDAKARASEMLRNPEIFSDPRLVGYLTRIEKEGFTSDEVNKAGSLVHGILFGDIDRSTIAGQSTPESILASVLLSHIDSTGAQGKVDVGEMERLFNYGMSGLSQAIGKTKYDYMSNKAWDEAMARGRIAYQHSLSQKAAAGAAAKNGKDPDNPQNEYMRNWYQKTFSGENGEQMRRRLDNFLGSDSSGKSLPMLVTKDGRYEVHDAADASNLVHGYDIRKGYKEKLGFDIGREISGKDRNLEDKWIYGENVPYDGQLIRTRYNPLTGSVQIMRPGDNKFRTSMRLTDEYNEGRKELLENYNYYKENEPDIFKRATIDPNSQYEFYTKNGIDYNVPLNELRDFVGQDMTTASGYSRTFVDVATPGLDEGEYSQKIADMMMPTLKQDNSGNLKRNGRDARINKNDFRYGIHLIDKQHNRPIPGSLKNPSKYLETKDGKITNLVGATLSLDAISNGYIIGKTRSGEEIAIGIERLNSQPIEAIYNQAAKDIYNILVNSSPDRTNAEKEEAVYHVLQDAGNRIQDNLGGRLVSKSETGTRSKPQAQYVPTGSYYNYFDDDLISDY